MMTSAEDSPNCGRLRPRKLSVGASQRVTRNSENKTADEKQSNVNIQSTSADKPLDSPVNKLLCPYCEKYFNVKPSLSKHVSRVHSSAASVKCQFCDHSDANVDRAVRHMIEHHPNDYFICLDCRTRFQTAQDREEHRLTCKKHESPIGKPYKNKLRAKTKTVHRKQIHKQKNDSSTPSKVIAEKPVFSGIVISCELKPPLQQETADIEDNITTNLILPPNKNIGSTGLEKNALIVLDDIQWNKRIPSNFCFHNSDADQILSRLGVVHRSPRVGESSRRDWYKHIEDSTKFEKCFDTSFYTKVASNVNENLTKYLDGSFNRFNLDPDSTIKTRKSKNSVAINTVEGFPTLLACDQYSRSVFDSYLPRSIAPRKKWKWEHLDLDKNPINQDQIKRFSHVTNCIITLVSSLDIWTQSCMRDKYEAKFNNTSFREKTFAKQNVICNELKEILESREIPNSSSAIVKHTKQSLPKEENIEFARSLGLVPREPIVELTPAKLSGECVRPRCFICCACGKRVPDYKTLRLHKSTEHPNAQVAHYEIVGKVLLDADIMKHLYVPPPQLSSARSRPPRGIKECTKCNKPISLEDLHQHILDCAGDTPVVKRKCRPKTFGSRRRRPRMPDNSIRKQMRKGMRHRQNTQKNILRTRPKVRTEVGDAETIRKMLADLPAKRHRVTINPVNSSGSRTRHDQNRIMNKSMIRKRAAEERHTAIPMRLREQNNANKHPGPSRGLTTKEINTSTTKKGMKTKTTKLQRTLIRKAKNQQANVKRSIPNLRSASVRKLRSAMSNTVLSKDDSIDSKPNKIDLTSGDSSTREHAARGSSNGRYQRTPDSNDQSRPDSNDQRGAQNQPPQDVPPLKHSIARLTASNVTHDKSVQFQPHFLVQQECYENIDHDHHMFMRVGQPVLFQNDYGECRLDKPPLDSYNSEYSNDNLFYQKNKNNKPRKGLNDCIAMLKNKLEDPIFPDHQTNQETQRRSVHCDSADMPQYQENNPSTSKEPEPPARDHYQTMLSPIPPAHTNPNVMSIISTPLDLSGKGLACISTNSDECYDTLDLSNKNAHAKGISDYQINDDENVVVDLRVKHVNEPSVTLDLSKKTKPTDIPADIDISRVRHQPREHSLTEPPLINISRVRYQHWEHSVTEPPLIGNSRVSHQLREHSVTEPPLIDNSRMRHQHREHSVTEPPLIDNSRIRHQPREHSVTEPPLIDNSKMRHQPRQHSMTEPPLIDNSRGRNKPREHSVTEPPLIDNSRVKHQPREHNVTEPHLIDNSRMRNKPREHSVTEPPLIDNSRVKHQPQEHTMTEPSLIDNSRVRHQPREHSVTEPPLIDNSRVRHQPREHSVTEPPLIDNSRVRHQPREHSVTEPPFIDNNRVRHQPREHTLTEPSLINNSRVRHQPLEHSVTEPPIPELELRNCETDRILPLDSHVVPALNIVTTLGGFSQVTTTTNELSVTTFTPVSMNTSPMCKLVSSSTHHESKKNPNTCKETNKTINYERSIPSTSVLSASTASHEIHVSKNKESVKSSDTDTAKKIAMLPKAIVEILGTMPVDSRNQLLNVLPQYMSYTCVDNKPNLEVETARESASVSGYLAKTEIATQTAATIQSDLVLDKSVSEISATTSHSTIIHNLASVSRNCETQVESTIYNNGNSLSNTNITPSHDSLTRPDKTTPYKTGNEKTASLRAVRIKTADRLKKLHQLPQLNKNVENQHGHGTNTPIETQSDIVTKLPAIQQAEVSSTHVSKIPIATENLPEREHILKMLEKSEMDKISDQKVLKSEELGIKSNETIQLDEKQVIIKSMTALNTPQTSHNHCKENKILPNFDKNSNSCVLPAKTSNSSYDIEVNESNTKNEDDSEDDISLALIVKQKNLKKAVSKPKNKKPKPKSNSNPKDTKRIKSQRKNKESLSNANVEMVPSKISQINSETTKPCKTASQVENPKRKSRGRNASTKVIECDENSTNNLITNNDKDQTSVIQDFEKETMANETSADELKAKTVEHIIDTNDTNKKGKKTYSDQFKIDILKDSLIIKESSNQKSIAETKSQFETQKTKSKQQLKELNQNVETNLDIQSENAKNNFASHESVRSDSELTSLNTVPSEITKSPENIDGTASEQKLKKVVRLKQDKEESPKDIKSNIQTKNDVVDIQADDHTTVKSLRRSRRGKSLYTEVLSANISLETITPKAVPLTKKQLIFTKMLLDEENLKIDNKKEESSKSKPSEEEKSDPSLQDELVQEKSHKRKFVTQKTISQKKHKIIKTLEKELLNSTDSDENIITKEIETSGSSKKVTNINVENKQCKADVLITELLESSKIRPELKSIEKNNKHEDAQQNNKEFDIIKPCKESGTSLTDVKSNQPEFYHIPDTKQGCSSLENIKCNSPTAPLLFKTDTDSEVECSEQTSTTNKRDAIKSTCYSNLTTSKRTRSQCLPKTWLENYDPYDIDLEDKLLEDVDPVNKKVVNWLRNSQKCALASKTSNKKPNTKKKTKLQAKESLETSAPICHTKKLENNSEQNDSDDSSKSDVPLTKYVSGSTKDIATILPRCLEDDTKDIDVKEGSSTKCENDDPIPGVSLQEDQLEVNTDSKKKNRGKKKKSQQADHANGTNLIEDTERLKSEQFMESFGFFSERKPRKSNLLATKKISETFHNVDDSDDLYSGSKERIAKKCRRKSSLRDDNKEIQTKSTSNVIKKTSRKKKIKFPQGCVCTKEQIERRETYCTVCEKQYRRPDNFLRHYFSLFHTTRVIKKQMHIDIEVIEDKPSFLGVYKEHLQRLIIIADKIDKKNKELILKSPDAPQTKVPTIGEIMDDARMQTIASQKSGRRGLSTDEALFLDCCELLNKSELPPAKEHQTLNQVSDTLDQVSNTLDQVSNNLDQVSNNLDQVSNNLDQMSDNLDQVSDNLDSRTPISKLIAAEKADQKSDGDVDSITARAIMESDEVRNLENDLISGFMIATSSNNGTDAIVKSNFETCNSEILSQTSMTDCLESEVEYRELYVQAKKFKSIRVGTTSKKINKTQRKCLKQKRKRTNPRDSICNDYETDSQDIILENKSSNETDTVEIDTKIEPGTSGSIQQTDPTFDIECTRKKLQSQSFKNKLIDSNSDLQKANISIDFKKKSKKPKKPSKIPRKKRLSETVKSCRDDTDVETKDEPFKEVNIFKDEIVDIFADKFDKIKRKALDSELDVQKTTQKINEDIVKKSQKNSIRTKRRRSKNHSSTREDSDSDTKEEPFQKINIFEDELVDMFEDKFDKIKRKCRSQVAAVKTTPAVVETSKSRHKGKTKVQKKEIQGIEAKAVQNIIMTKGALKGFESIKVSIPTTDIDISAITSTVSENKQRKRKRHSAKKRRVKRYDNCERCSKDSPKHLDVYEFIDDDTDMFEFRPSTIKERFKSTFKDAPTTSKTVQVEKHRNESSSSGTDGDDFVYMSDDYVCSAQETEAENSEQSSGAQYSCEAKRARKKETIEKNTVMGKIFKNNAIRTDKKSLGKTNEKQKTSLDQLFDSLLEDGPNSFDAKTDNKEKELPSTNLSNDEDSVMNFKDFKSFEETNSQSPNPVIDSLSSPPRGKHSAYNKKETRSPADVLEFSSDNSAGVARHRTRRKCAVGKQNVLAESWSSESECEKGHSNSGESVDATGGNKKRRPKRGGSLQAGVKRGRYAGKKVERIPRVHRRAVINEEFGNDDEPTVDQYAWSSNNELLESGHKHAQQHGWIVGDSHKKLVTMLALKKTDNGD